MSCYSLNIIYQVPDELNPKLMLVSVFKCNVCRINISKSKGLLFTLVIVNV